MAGTASLKGAFHWTHPVAGPRSAERCNSTSSEVLGPLVSNQLVYTGNPESPPSPILVAFRQFIANFVPHR
jgi:hypothetical protein